MAEVLAGIGGLFGSGAGAATAAPTLGVATSMPQIAIPSSVLPLSQQIGNMQQPLLTNPMSAIKQGPSLGVDTSIAKPELVQTTESNPIFSDSTRALLSVVNTNAQQNLKNAMPWMQLAARQQPAQIQQTDLMSILKNLGGNY